MIITEAVFASFREWHRNVVARAFVAEDDDIIFVFCALNIFPGELEVPENACGLAALRIHSRCCHNSIVMTERDRLEILRLLRTRSLSGARRGRGGSCEEMEDVKATFCVCADQTDVLESIRRSLHVSSCWWCQGDIMRQLLRSPRFALTDLALIRHRCSAVAVMDNISNSSSSFPSIVSSASPSSSSPFCLRADISSAVNVGATSQAKLLLPRGSPPSFVRDSLLPPLLTWLHGWAARSLQGLTSETPASLLQAIFALKRTRNEEGDPRTEGECDDIVSSVGLLVALLGYTIFNTPTDNVLDSAIANGVADSVWCQLGVDMSCYFCGGRPLLKVEKVLVEKKEDVDAKGVVVDDMDTNNNPGALSVPDLLRPCVSDVTSEVDVCMQGKSNEETVASTQEEEALNLNEDDMHAQGAIVAGKGAGITSVCKHFVYTLLLSEQSDCTGHHKRCPWRELFISPVLADAVLSPMGKEINFNVHEACERRACLRLSFKLPEVIKLMESWRRSLYADSVWKEAYARHPLPAAVRSVIPFSADPETEAYLQKLETRDAETVAGEKEQVTFAVPHNALFDNDSFFDSYLRVASFLKAAVTTQQSKPTVSEMRGNKNESGEIPFDDGAKVEAETHWKAVYDMGRRCLLNAAGGMNTDTAAQLSKEFTELYKRGLERDSAAEPVSPSLGSAMDKIFQLLGTDVNVDDAEQFVSGEDFLSTPPEQQQNKAHLSSEDQRRLQSFMDVFVNGVEGDRKEVPVSERQSEAGHGASADNSADSTQRKATHNAAQQSQSRRRQKRSQQQQQQQQQHLVSSHLRQPAHVSSEGILPFPGGCVLPTPVSFVQHHQQQQHHHHLSPPHLFSSTAHGFQFRGPGINIAQRTDGVGILDNAFMPQQRPSVMGQRRPMQAGTFAAERKYVRGGSRRGGRGGGHFKKQ